MNKRKEDLEKLLGTMKELNDLLFEIPGHETDRFEPEETEEYKILPPRVNVDLRYGEPRLAKIGFDDEQRELEIILLVPGVPEGGVNIWRGHNFLEVSMDQEVEFTKKFRVAFRSSDLCFANWKCQKSDGVLSIVIPTNGTDENIYDKVAI